MYYLRASTLFSLSPSRDLCGRDAMYIVQLYIMYNYVVLCGRDTIVYVILCGRNAKVYLILCGRDTKVYVILCGRDTKVYVVLSMWTRS